MNKARPRQRSSLAQTLIRQDRRTAMRSQKNNRDQRPDAPPGGELIQSNTAMGVGSPPDGRDATLSPTPVWGLRPQGRAERVEAREPTPTQRAEAAQQAIDLTPDGLWAAFLQGKNPKTMRAYQQDFRDFQQFLGLATPQEACAFLLQKSQAEVNAISLSYLHALQQRKLAPATQNRRIAAIKSLLKLARFVGVSDKTVELRPVAQEKYRDTHGPGREGFLQMLAILEEDTSKKSLRDRAILRLLYDIALRRFEVVSLDLRHYDPKRGTLSIMGKGRQHRQLLQLPEPTRAVIEAWLDKRGREHGPLFTTLDPAKKGSGRLTDNGLYLMIKELGQKIGIEVRPHGLRHAAITDALDATQGDVRAVQRFSRHKDLRVLTHYDDARQDLGAEVSRLVASRGASERDAK